MDLTAVKDFFERVQTQAFAENIQEAVKLLTKASSIIFVGVGNSSFIRSRQYFVEKGREQLQSHCLYQERRNRH